MCARKKDNGTPRNVEEEAITRASLMATAFCYLPGVDKHIHPQEYAKEVLTCLELVPVKLAPWGTVPELISEAFVSIQLHYGYPPHLAKACCDPFDYLVALRDGSWFRFEQADAIDKDWVRLDGLVEMGRANGQDGWPCPRGVDVRVSDIVYVTDAPHGS